MEVSNEKKKGVKRGEEKGRMKRTKRGLLKEDVKVLFLWKPMNFLSRVKSGELWWSFFGGPRGEDLFDREPDTCALVRVVPEVTGVPFSPSSVITEVCEGFLSLLGLRICGTAVLFFLQNPCSLLYSYAGRDEV